MNWCLPKLPTYNFKDPTKTKYHISAKCKSINGYHFVENGGLGIGHRPLDIDSIGFIEIDKSARFNPALMYGKVKSREPRKFVPHHAIYANKCLTFRAYYKQTLPHVPDDFLLHYVNLHYYLEDDTIKVIEPEIPNSGYIQGLIIRRRRIEKPNSGDFWHWKDLNVGMDIDLQGIIFHTIGCDEYTMEYMRSQGIDVNTSEEIHVSQPKTSPRYHLYQRKRNRSPSKPRLQNHSEVLNFHAIWEEDPKEDNLLVEPREFIITYFLEDETLIVKEIYKRNDGHDPFPKALKRMRVPKNEENYFTPIYAKSDDEEIDEYIEAYDFTIGEIVHIFGRKFLIINCDPLTRQFYKSVLNFTQPEPVDLEKHYGIIRNPFTKQRHDLRYKIAKDEKVFRKDELKLIMNANEYLRYSGKLISGHPEDDGRKFIFSYALADDTIKIVELKQPNSGIEGGVFLQRQRIPKTDNEEYVTITDFQIGALIYVYCHVFQITGADLKVYHYLNQNRDNFPSSLYANIRNYMLEQGLIREPTTSSEIAESNIETCYLRKNEQEPEMTYPNKDYDFNAPGPECRYPLVVDGKLMVPEPACEHARDRDVYKDIERQQAALKQKEREISRRLAKFSNSDLIESHIRPECPIDSCLAENPYNPAVNKRVSFLS